MNSIKEFSIYDTLYVSEMCGGESILREMYVPTVFSRKPFEKYNGDFLESHKIYIRIEPATYLTNNDCEYVFFRFYHMYLDPSDTSSHDKYIPIKNHFDNILELDKMLRVISEMFRENIIDIENIIEIINDAREVLKDCKHKYPFINLTKQQIFESWKLIKEFMDELKPRLSDSDNLYIELTKGKL